MNRYHVPATRNVFTVRDTRAPAKPRATPAVAAAARHADPAAPAVFTTKAPTAGWLGQQRHKVKFAKKAAYDEWLARHRCTAGQLPNEAAPIDFGADGLGFRDKCISVLLLVHEAANFNWRRCKPFLEAVQAAEADEDSMAAADESTTGPLGATASTGSHKSVASEADMLKFDFTQEWRVLRDRVLDTLRQHARLRDALESAAATGEPIDPMEHAALSKTLDATTPEATVVALTVLSIFDVSHCMPTPEELQMVREHRNRLATRRPSTPAQDFPAGMDRQDSPAAWLERAIDAADATSTADHLSVGLPSTVSDSTPLPSPASERADDVPAELPADVAAAVSPMKAATPPPLLKLTPLPPVTADMTQNGGVPEPRLAFTDAMDPRKLQERHALVMNKKIAAFTSRFGHPPMMC